MFHVPLSEEEEEEAFLRGWIWSRGKWAIQRESIREPQPCRWVILTTPPVWACFCRQFTSMCSHAAHRKKTGKEEWMKEAEGGVALVVVVVAENWDIKEKRENKSPSEEDDASWLEKQQGILSLSHPPFSYLQPASLSSPLFASSPRYFNELCRDCAHARMLSVELRTHTHAAWTAAALQTSHNQVEAKTLTMCSKTC